MPTLLIDTDNLLTLVNAMAANGAAMTVKQAIVVETEDYSVSSLLAKLGARKLSGISERSAKAQELRKASAQRGICPTCGKDREISHDGECKLCKMARAKANKTAASAPGEQEAKEPEPGGEVRVPEAEHKFSERPAGPSAAERELQARIDRVVERARAKTPEGTINPGRKQEIRTARRLG